MQEDLHKGGLAFSRVRFFVPALAVSLTVADAVAKVVAHNTLSTTEGLSLIPGLAAFLLHINEGVVANLAIPMPIVLLGSIAIIVTLCFWFKRAWMDMETWNVYGLSLIIAGALGNFVERLIFGITTDYLLLWNRSVINLADILILLGLALLVFAPRSHSRS